ncbi:MAG: aryl-sulfate sulfotransferase [Flavobacteriales bacterium]|jgi:hypothetical protein
MKKFLLRATVALLFIFTVTFSSAQQWGDYTLIATQNGTSALLVDTLGATYHTWTFPSSAKTGYSTYMLPGGELMRTISNQQQNQLNGGGMTGRVQHVDYSGNVLWDFTYSTANYCIHHDICVMPNGNVLMIAYEVKSSSEVSAAGSQVSHTMWPDKIIEVMPTGATTGEIVWEWHAWDHLCQDVDPTKANYVSDIAEHPELLNLNYNNTQQTTDWMHCNGIDYNPALDQIVISSHFLDEIYIIDHSTTTAEAASHTGGQWGRGGDLLYRWGSPQAYGMSGNGIYNVIHDAHWIPEGPLAGSIAVFNNNGVSNNQSAVDIIASPWNGSDYGLTAGTYFPSTYTQRHACFGHTNNMGNSYQLPNGNMLVCIAQDGLVYEIDSDGNNIWEKQVNGTVPHAYRYSACYLAGTVPNAPTVTSTGNVLMAEGGTAFQWYVDGVMIPGATLATHTALVSGNYQAQVVEAGGCRSPLSEGVSVIVNEVSETDWANMIRIYPNPAGDYVRIVTVGSAASISIRDTQGRVVATQTTNSVVDTHSWPAGVYTITIQSEIGIRQERLIIQH